MKYVISSTARLNGSGKENEAAMRRGLELYSKWTPPASSTIHQFVGRVDGGGSFAVVETDDPADLLGGWCFAWQTIFHHQRSRFPGE
jgi:Domain of unknown function (DUF3303)